jgi:signal transduction histidine kinase
MCFTPPGSVEAEDTVQAMPRDALESMSEAVLAIAAEREVEPVLRRLVHSARELAGARYAALGIPDGEGAFAQFITAGMSDELIAAMGPLPRTHGLLGAMLETPVSHRTPDIREDPRFRGWWPRAHPQMRSFLGVPIVARGNVIAAFYLTDKDGAEQFTEEDQRLIEMLAAHAAVAIENARLTERSRELSIVEERNRLARELHDSVSQKLFGLVLTAEAATTLLGREDGAAGEQVTRLGELAQEALTELRELIFELRPPSLEDEGLAATLRKEVDMLRRVHGRDIELRIAGAATCAPENEAEVLRVAQEALHNALRHAEAERIELRMEARDGRLVVTVADDGVGFDPDAPGVRSRRLGLTSMEERARALGGSLAVVSRPGEGTTVTLEVPP